MRFPSTSALFSAVVSLRMAALVVSAVAAIPDAAARFSAAREVWRALEGPASVCTAIFFRFAGGSGPLWSSPSAAVSPPSSPNPKICMLARFPLRFSLRSACRFAIPSSCFLIRCAAPHSKTWISSFWFSEYPGLSSSLSGWGARESIAIGCPSVTGPHLLKFLVSPWDGGGCFIEEMVSKISVKLGIETELGHGEQMAGVVDGVVQDYIQIRETTKICVRSHAMEMI
ncbi:hypothetical protein AcV5_010495 [Taiwanofungus camphoratus]|nr:hypothetical protein AcV5_010495 [Antrodia cinnamomea]